MTSTDPHRPSVPPPPPPGPWSGATTSPYAPPRHPEPLGQHQPSVPPTRPPGGSLVVTALLTVGGVAVVPLAYLLLAHGVQERYRVFMTMAQAPEAVLPSLLVLLGVALLAAVAAAAGRAPLAAIVPGALLGLGGLHGLVDPLRAYRLSTDLLGDTTGAALGLLSAVSAPLLVSGLLLGAGLAGVLGRHRRRRAVRP